MTMQEQTELVNVRVPVSLLNALRLTCQSTGRSMSSEIRQGIQMRYDELRRDADVRRKVKEHIEEMQRLFGPEELAATQTEPHAEESIEGPGAPGKAPTTSRKSAPSRR